MISRHTLQYDKLNLIATDIPKNASTTFKNWVCHQYGWSGYEYMGEITPKYFWNYFRHIKSPKSFKQSDYTKLIILRHPYKRFISGFCNKFLEHHHDQGFAGNHLRNIGISKPPKKVSIIEILKAMDNTKNKSKFDLHFMPQYLYFRGIDIHLYDYILQVSSLTEQFNKICKKEGWGKLQERSIKTPYRDIPEDDKLHKRSVQEIKNKYGVPKQKYFLNNTIKSLIKSVYEKDYSIFTEVFNETI
jgi:hypothetical protein